MSRRLTTTIAVTLVGLATGSFVATATAANVSGNTTNNGWRISYQYRDSTNPDVASCTITSVGSHPSTTTVWSDAVADVTMEDIGGGDYDLTGELQFPGTGATWACNHMTCDGGSCIQTLANMKCRIIEGPYPWYLYSECQACDGGSAVGDIPIDYTGPI